MFIMVVVDVEHPPACGTALGIVVDGFSSELALAVVLSSLLLAAAHYFFKPYMKNLV
jgi:CBS-domain-containing membrane protein